jgi:DNA polymerase
MKIREQMWDGMLDAYKECKLCRLGETVGKRVFSRGPSTAHVLFIGEGPGKLEDVVGKPFIGRAGQLLDRAIADTGIKAECFFTNLVCCRPCDRVGGQNRPPAEDEIQACGSRLQTTVSVVAPRAIVLLGRVARLVLEGKPYLKPYRVFHAEHPAFILRVGGVKSVAYPVYVKKIKEALRAAV